MANHNVDDSILPIGTKSGCLTIIGGFEEYDRIQEEKAQQKITEYSQQKEKYLKTGELDSNIPLPPRFFLKNPIRTFDRLIEMARHWKEEPSYCQRYKVQCKCGKIHYVDQVHFLKKRHRYCDTINGEYRRYDNYINYRYCNYDDCGLRIAKKEEQYKAAQRVKDKNYYSILPFSIHESLNIKGRGEDMEIESWVLRNHRRRPFFIIKQTYLCECYLCGKEMSFCYDDFEIQNYAEYYSRAHCDCHPISSFQWRTIDILKKHNIHYKVEVSFQDLIGIGGCNKLRFDFGIYSSDGDLLLLMECQGEQHYKPVEEFGGDRVFESQIQNDELKRIYARNHNITLIEIPFTCRTYAKEEDFLRKHGVI